MIGRIVRLGRGYRHLGRLREIFLVLARHGFGDFAQRLGLPRPLRARRSRGARDVVDDPTRWQRMRMVIEELGPAFIKLGQIMSNRPDLLPNELIDELEKLQDAVPPFPARDSRALIESEFGRPIESIFRRFDDIPLATASIAQVHRAELPDGTPVAVKVQRPGIERVIDVDLEIMRHLAALMEKYVEGAGYLNPVGVVEEFERVIRQEIDFHLEAIHLERFAANFSGNRTIRVPRVHKSHSTRRVLTMEYIEGTKLSGIIRDTAPGANLKLVASRGADLLLEQIFQHGFFHADPHPGNIFIMPKNVICFLDFGMMGSLPESQREQFVSIIFGAVTRDARRITGALQRLTEERYIEQKHRLERRLSDLLDQYAYLPLKNIDIARLLRDLIGTLIAFRLTLSPNFYLLVKSFITIEGVARMLDPDFNIVEHMEPLAKRLFRERLHPKRVARDAAHAAVDLAFLLRDLPYEVRELIDQLKGGKVRIVFEHQGLESMIRRHDAISARIATAILVAALVVGSSLIVLAGVPPLWRGVPTIGVAGFVLAAVLAFGLSISMIWRGTRDRSPDTSGR